MKRSTRRTILVALFVVFALQSGYAYDIPARKIEIKPYINLLMPNDIWETEAIGSVVDDKAAFGFGAKIRTQFSRQFGIVLNSSYLKFKVLDNSSDNGVIFTAGGYLGKSFEVGNLTLDLSYGVISAADEIMGLLFPSVEFSRPISDRMSLALELGMPIPNDWFRDFGFKENIGSFTLTAGTIIVF